MATFKLLSIDGGGIRGLLPAMVLAHIEARTSKPIHALFDAVAGTSTGAILALALVRKDAVLGDAQRMVDLYLQHGPAMFSETWRDKLLTPPSWFARWLGLSPSFDVNDLGRPKYASKNRHNILAGYFGDARLLDAKLPVFIPCYDTVLRCPVFFTSRLAHKEQRDDYYESTPHASMLDACLGSTAAPTYFEPYQFPRAGAGGSYTLIDGSIIASNPTGLAHSFLRGPDVTGDIVLSLGTGSMQHPYSYDTIREWGMLSWAAPALKMVMDGQSEAVGVTLRKRLAASDYLRIQAMLDDNKVSDDLDDCSRRNMQAIVTMGSKLIDKHSASLDAICRRLMEVA